jgi:uncharacterized membrane protein
MKKILPFVIILLLAVCAFATKGSAPKYRSLRVLGMGNAFIAVADNKDAIYYNPAGLNLIGTLGNFEDNPNMGYMPKNETDWRFLNFSFEFPGSVFGDIMDVCGTKGISKLLSDPCPELWYRIMGRKGYEKLNSKNALDEIEAHEKYLSEGLSKLDRKPMNFGVQVSLFELAMHNFGLAIWTNTRLSPYIDLGIGEPFGGWLPMIFDIVAQTAIAFSPVDEWSVGVGFKAVKRATVREYEIHALEYEQVLDTLKERGSDVGDVFTENYTKLDYALEFGVLHQLTREVRLGTSLRDLFLGKLAGESVTPNLSMGVAYTPMILQSNSWWDRKVNLAMDYVDVLDGTVGSMFFSHLNIGAEVEQNLLPSPTRDMSFFPRLLFGALGCAVGYIVGSYVGDRLVGDIGGISIGSYIGATFGTIGLGSVGFGGDFLRASVGGGFEGGYWSATGALKTPILAVRISSFAEEMGVRTGQSENRHYMIQFGSDF